MQSPRTRALSPRPLTRRTSKRNPGPGSPFHLPPASPTTPTTTPTPAAPPPSPSTPSSPARPVRRLSSRVRQKSDLTRRLSDLTRKQSDRRSPEKEPSRRSELTRQSSDLTRRSSDLSRRVSHRLPQVPESPRRVTFGGEKFEYLPGDSSDEDEPDCYPDPVHVTRPSESPDTPRRHSSRGREGDDGAASPRRGRSSSRGAPGKRSPTPFVRRDVNWEDEDEDEDVGDDADRGGAIVNASSCEQSSDESVVRRGRSANETDDGPSSRRGRGSSRGAPAKRSATPFVRRSMNWEDEDEDDDQGDEPKSERRTDKNVQFNLCRGESNGSEGSMRRGRSKNESDDEPPSSRRGRSSSRGARAKRSATPFVRRNINWEDEDDEDDEDNHTNGIVTGKEGVDVNASGGEREYEGIHSARARQRDQKDHDANNELVVRRSSSASSNLNAPLKHSATAPVKYTWNGAYDEDPVEKVEEVGWEEVERIEDYVTVIEDGNDLNSAQNADNVRRDIEETDNPKRAGSREASSKRGDLEMIVRCSCGKAQVISYGVLTGIDIRPA